MNNLTTFIILVGVIIAASFFRPLLKAIEDRDAEGISAFTFLASFVPIILFVVALVLIPIIRTHTSDSPSTQEVAITENWDCYYNGNQTEIENLDLTQYEVTYDTEQKKVFLTDKKESILPWMIWSWALFSKN